MVASPEFYPEGLLGTKGHTGKISGGYVGSVNFYPQ